MLSYQNICNLNERLEGLHKSIFISLTCLNRPFYLLVAYALTCSTHVCFIENFTGAYLQFLYDLLALSGKVQRVELLEDVMDVKVLECVLPQDR